jgi:hypothetical protein
LTICLVLPHDPMACCFAVKAYARLPYPARKPSFAFISSPIIASGLGCTMEFLGSLKLPRCVVLAVVLALFMPTSKSLICFAF